MILRRVAGMFRIELPLDNVLYQSSRWISHARVSPRGDRIAFMEHPIWGDDSGVLVIIDTAGKEILRSSTSWVSTGGLAWTPKSDEVWVAAEHLGYRRDIVGVTMSGRQRMLLTMPGRLSIHDIAPNGDVLMGFENARREAVGARIDDAQERNLTWFDWSWLGGLSPDGKMILIVEQATAVGGRNTAYVRPIDGAPAVQLSVGHARGNPFSRDSKWIVLANEENRLEMMPVGVGQPRAIPDSGLEDFISWQPFADNERLLLFGNEHAQPQRLHELSLASGARRQISELTVGWPVLLSNDDRTVAAMGEDDRVLLFSVDSGAVRPAAGCKEGDVPIGWTADDRALYVYQRGRTEIVIERIDIESGERTPWHTIRPADPAGINDIMPVCITADGQTYAYGYRRFLTDLYIVSGLG